jgi:hypothetical protein
MNAVRVWILRLASIAAVLWGGSLLYTSYEDFAWRGLALAESHYNVSQFAEISDEAAKKEADGRAAMNAGLALVVAALLMDGLAALLKQSPRKPATKVKGGEPAENSN